MDVATGSLLTGIYTCFLSLVFIAIGVESLVDASKDSHNQRDMLVLNAVYGLVIALSILFAIASVSLVLGAARKLKTYVISWIVLAPLWTCLTFCQLIVLPATLGPVVGLSNATSRVCGTAFIVVTNLFCMLCVYLFFATLAKSPAHKLRRLGVVEALETGFSSGYSRLRESIRPSKSKPSVNFRNTRASADRVSLPDVSVSVVLDPNKLEVSRPNKRRSSPAARQVDRSGTQAAEASDSYTQSLSTADQLDNGVQQAGFVNVAFATGD